MKGVILAGGKSKRMGQDKALISVGGESLIFHVYKAFKHQGLMKSSFLDYRIIIRAYRSYLMTQRSGWGLIFNMEMSRTNFRSWVFYSTC